MLGREQPGGLPSPPKEKQAGTKVEGSEALEQEHTGGPPVLLPAHALLPLTAGHSLSMAAFHREASKVKHADVSLGCSTGSRQKEQLLRTGGCLRG